ncbi:MAG: DUF1501 domain-containing protein [Myxococcaceae bacterium]
MAASLGVRVSPDAGRLRHPCQPEAPARAAASAAVRGASALLDDAAEHGSGSRLVVMTYSEFGRRARENASGGTDHGAGSVAFLAGERVVGGLDGRLPRLDALIEGDVPSSTDFRSLYSAILRDWLGVAPALGQAAVLGVLRPAA